MSAGRADQVERAFELQGRADCLGAGVLVRTLARGAGWSDVEAEELALLVIELATNAVRHGGGGRCRVELGGAELRLTVEDSGGGFPAPVLEDGGRSDGLGAGGPVPPLERRGLGSGLAAARRLADELHLSNPSSGGAHVFARRRRRHPRRGGSDA